MQRVAVSCATARAPPARISASGATPARISCVPVTNLVMKIILDCCDNIEAGIEDRSSRYEVEFISFTFYLSIK